MVSFLKRLSAGYSPLQLEWAARIGLFQEPAVAQLQKQTDRWLAL